MDTCKLCDLGDSVVKKKTPDKKVQYFYLEKNYLNKEKMSIRFYKTSKRLKHGLGFGHGFLPFLLWMAINGDAAAYI